MKKILIAFDGGNYSEGALRFALELHRRSPVFITGLFIPEAYFANLWSYSVGVPGGMILPLEEDETAEVAGSIERFEQFCRSHQIDFATHKQYNDFSISALIRESRFADLMIIGSEKFYQVMGTELNEYLKETLRESECPVIVVPEEFEFPSSQILAYDGSRSSVFAIKQFAYLLPELADNDTLLVFLSEKDEEIPERRKIEELVKRHFTQINFLHLQMEPEKYFKTWMEERKQPLLVSGSFGGSGLARAFHRSFVSGVLKEHAIPVFIAHP